jgi:hypothetical protein
MGRKRKKKKGKAGSPGKAKSSGVRATPGKPALSRIKPATSGKLDLARIKRLAFPAFFSTVTTGAALISSAQASFSCLDGCGNFMPSFVEVPSPLQICVE